MISSLALQLTIKFDIAIKSRKKKGYKMTSAFDFDDTLSILDLDIIGNLTESANVDILTKKKVHITIKSIGNSLIFVVNTTFTV